MEHWVFRKKYASCGSVVTSAWFPPLARVTHQAQTHRRPHYKYDTKHIFPIFMNFIYQFTHISTPTASIKVSSRTTDSFWIELFTSFTYFHVILTEQLVIWGYPNVIPRWLNYGTPCGGWGGWGDGGGGGGWGGGVQNGTLEYWTSTSVTNDVAEPLNVVEYHYLPLVIFSHHFDWDQDGIYVCMCVCVVCSCVFIIMQP